MSRENEEKTEKKKKDDFLCLYYGEIFKILLTSRNSLPIASDESWEVQDKRNCECFNRT